MTLWERQRDGTLSDVAPANFVAWRDASRSFSGMAAVRTSSFASSFILGGQSEASRLAGGDVSSSFFSVLGVRFMLGRSFLPEEDRPGGNRAAILSYPAWRDRFGADRDIAGKAIPAPALLAGVALAASYLPALRATRVDPMVALRYE